MKEAILYKKLPKGNVRCGVCQRRCSVAPDNLGYCYTRINKDGKFYSLIYEVISSANIDPIEKKPLFHFYPGTQVFSIGSLGCNFRCKNCQNWEISYAEPTIDHLSSQTLSPQEVINQAKKYKCAGIAFTYNEPTIWLEYTLDVMKLAKKAGLYTVYVTNGYITPEALDLIGPYLDAFRVDIKAFSKKFYQEIASVPDFKPILEMTKRAKKKWKMHVEIITLIIPTFNDNEKELKELASWIKKDLGADTPWHLTRFFPAAEMTNIPPTPIKELEKLYEIGKKAGLKFVYLGNVSEHPLENTYCPKCKKLLIERQNYFVKKVGLKNGKCKFCGQKLNIII